MTKWHYIHVPRGDYWHVRRLGAETEWKGFRLWINATQVRSRVFKNWLNKENERKLKVEIAFDERDDAKKHGCCWCPDIKSWVFVTCRPDKEIPDFVMKRRGSAPRIWFNVPFAMKEEVKKFGGSWDATKKMWYMRKDRFDAVTMEPLKKYVVKM
jgi:Domain of unknown function (DUF5710)